jgi:dihydroflavonol-4-reductase
MSETVLVTGGTGFVAGWVIAELLNRGYTVRTTVRDASRAPARPDKVSYAVADVTRDDGWDAAMDGVDHVLHVASPLGATQDLIGPARDGTLRVLRAATGAGVKRVVVTSAAGTTLTTILPGAVFGPLRSPDNLGSVRIVQRMVTGKKPGTPRIGLEIVDVRDLAGTAPGRRSTCSAGAPARPPTRSSTVPAA